MRSAEHTVARTGAALMALLVQAALLSGCSLLPARLLPGSDHAAAPAAPATSSTANAASAASAASTATPPPAAASAPRPAAAPHSATAAASAPVAVSPATQQAYDEALRLQRAGRLAEAERALRALAKEQPSLAGVHANLGLLLRQAGKPAESLAALERAAQLNPQQAQIQNELGIAHRLRGQFGPAREAYERAIALDPGYAAAHLNLGILLDLYLGDGAAAMARYERYQALVPGGDAAVGKWLVDLKNRKPATASPGPASQGPAPQQLSAATLKDKP